MSVLGRVVSLLFAIGVAAGLWYLWPPVTTLLKGTWLHDLRIPIIAVYVVLGLWLAERVWALIKPVFERKEP